MRSLAKPLLALLAVVALAAACRANLPLNEPPQPTADGAPALRTNDGPTGPRSDEGLSSLPDATGGTSSLSPPPLGGTNTGNVGPN